MGVVVSLKDVVDAMDVPNDDWTSYVNPKTGEIVTVTDEDRQLVEDEDLDEATLPEWRRESLPSVRAALESDDFLALPDADGGPSREQFGCPVVKPADDMRGWSIWTFEHAMLALAKNDPTGQQRVAMSGREFQGQP